MECADEWTTTKWFEAISRILTEPAAKLEDYRRTKENVPFVGNRIFLLDYPNFSDSRQMHQFRRIVRIAVWGGLPQKWEDCRGQRNQGKTHSRLDILLKLIYLEKKKTWNFRSHRHFPDQEGRRNGVRCGWRSSAVLPNARFSTHLQRAAGWDAQHRLVLLCLFVLYSMFSFILIDFSNEYKCFIYSV